VSEHPKTEPHELPPASGLPENPPPLDIPGPPRTPTFDREAATLPPGHADLVDYPLPQDPMEHAPPWGRHLNGRVTDLDDRLASLADELRTAMDPNAGIPALRSGLLSDLSAWLKPHIDEFMRVVAVQEKAISGIAEEQDKLMAAFHDLKRENVEFRRRIEELEAWRTNTKDRAP